MLSAAYASLVEQSEILQHHPLSTSDHFPVKIVAKWSAEGNDASLPPRKIKWTEAIEEDLTKEYAKKVVDIIRPLTGIPYPSMKALEVEICAVASKIIAAASYRLPHTGLKKSKKKKLYIKNEALQSICKEQRKARKRWSDAGEPRIGPLYEQQKALKRYVSQYLRDLQAAEEQQEIQKRDKMFRSHDQNWFRKPATRAPCGDRLKHLPI